MLFHAEVGHHGLQGCQVLHIGFLKIFLRKRTELLRRILQQRRALGGGNENAIELTLRGVPCHCR